MSVEDEGGRRAVKVFEAVRVLGTAAGLYLAYAAQKEPITPASIRILAMTFAFAMGGPCAAEGLLLARAAARAKGFGGKNGDVGSPYHLQSTLWFLASAIVGGTWCLILPDDTWAFLLYSILIASFFMLSLMNHAWQAIVHGNRTRQNLSRPILAIALIAGSVPILLRYM